MAMTGDGVISLAQMTQQLLALGVRPGGVLLVHCAFSKVKPVEDGPLGLIAALQAAVGEDGTLVMPGMTDDDDHVFDPRRTPCLAMGVVADSFRRLPQVLCSDSPHSFSARGSLAGRISAPHPVDVPHGLDSPVGRVYELDGQTLLLGVGHGANTAIHLGEWLAGVRYRRQKHVLVRRNGRTERIEYAEIDHCCEKFDLVDGWPDAGTRQRHGMVGHAHARLMRTRAVVDTVVAQLHENETVFLHPPGVDEECDGARASLVSQ